VRIAGKSAPDMRQFGTQQFARAAEIMQRAIVRGDRGIQRLHRLFEKGEAHFEFGKSLFEGRAHGDYNLPSEAFAGSTYFTSYTTDLGLVNARTPFAPSSRNSR
jgi:hypothetical protein